MRSKTTARKRNSKKRSSRKLSVRKRSKKRGGMRYEDADIAHERELTKLRKDILDTKAVIAKFEREMAKNPDDSLLAAQMELLQNRLNQLERDYNDKNSQTIQGWI